MDSARLTKVLIIGGQQVTNIVSDAIQLDLFSTGRAIFTIVSDAEPSGIVELSIGYQVTNLTPYFLGVIESKHQNNGKWFLTCRELIGALSFPAPVSLRHPTLTDVLAQLERFGLEFVYPDTDYTRTPVPRFCHHGDGISLLRQIGKIFQIPNFIFQQRPDGKIYIGAWLDSRWPSASVDNFAEHPIKTINSTSGELPVIPKLRPGLKLNGRYVVQTTLNGNKQVITWSQKLLNA